MNYRRMALMAVLTLVAVCLVVGARMVHPFTAYAQHTAEPAATIRAESRLVLVDVVVTDKKGDYVQDLAEKDFRVWEDDHEQKITSFSFEQSASSDAAARKRHLVLFFDDDSMQAIDQSRARAAAGKFLDGDSQAGNYVAVIDYAGTMQVAQNFTNDTERLKKVVSAPKMSTASTEEASLGSPVFSIYDSYSNRNVLLALRSVARSLATIPGRKILVWLTAGFPLTPDNESEMTALINVCNKANVAIYALDVRGLTGAVIGEDSRPEVPSDADAELDTVGLYSGSSGDVAGKPHLVYVAQTKTGTGATGGATGTGGRTGTTPPRRVVPPPVRVYPTQPIPQTRTIVPPFPPSAAINQQVLYAVATGTGGFVIVNTNDLLSGLQKISKEQTEYYVLGYVPPEGPEGACHTLQVKVDRSGTQVRARSGYCATKPVDFLAGKPIAKQLEERAMSNQPGAISGSVAAPFFYTSPGTARVNLAMEIPGKAIQFEKLKGKQHAIINVLGLATNADGTVAARFSDAVELNLEKQEAEDLVSHPFPYENQFYISTGKYTLKVAVNSGEKYGQFEMPLVIDGYDPTKFGMSDLALSTQFYKVSDNSTALDAELLQDRTPLVTQGLQLVPTGSNRFKSSDRVAIYLEVYEPQAPGTAPPKVGLRLHIVDEKTGKSALEANVPDTSSSAIPGNPVIPMGVPLPVAQLQPGNYVVELQASDSAGHASVTRRVEFTVE